MRLDEIENRQVAEIFSEYPKDICQKLLFLRQIVIETALEIEGVGELEEALKWEDPSYLVKTGSTIRLGWRKSKPLQYGMYFHCGTNLVETFRVLYSDKFQFEGDRAIVFNLDSVVAVEKLKNCIKLSLTYHRIKKLPMLGQTGAEN